jgi:hypothetical protein
LYYRKQEVNGEKQEQEQEYPDGAANTVIIITLKNVQKLKT